MYSWAGWGAGAGISRRRKNRAKKPICRESKISAMTSNDNSKKDTLRQNGDITGKVSSNVHLAVME
jgi:hypothetical protein